MHSQLTYSDLDAILCQVGFIRTSSEGPHQLYEHPREENAIILLPPTQPDATVRPHHLAMVRTTLDVNGIIDRGDFDQLLAKKALTPV